MMFTVSAGLCAWSRFVAEAGRARRPPASRTLVNAGKGSGVALRRLWDAADDAASPERWEQEGMPKNVSVTLAQPKGVLQPVRRRRASERSWVRAHSYKVTCSRQDVSEEPE